MRYFRCSVGKHKRKAIQCSSCCLWGYNDHISPLQDKESFFYGVVVAYMGSLNIEQRTIFSLLWCCNSFFNKHDFILQYMNNTDHWYIYPVNIYSNQSAKPRYNYIEWYLNSRRQYYEDMWYRMTFKTCFLKCKT